MLQSRSKKQGFIFMVGLEFLDQLTGKRITCVSCQAQTVSMQSKIRFYVGCNECLRHQRDEINFRKLEKKLSGLLFEACTPYHMKIEYQETRIYL